MGIEGGRWHLYLTIHYVIMYLRNFFFSVIRSSLDLEINTMNIDGQVLCDEYMHIVNSYEDEPEVTHFEDLAGRWDFTILN